MSALGQRRRQNPLTELRAGVTDTHRMISDLRAELREIVQPSVKHRTITELAADFLPRKLPKISSAASFSGRINNYVVGRLGHHTAGTLRKRDVESFLLGLAKDGLSAQTINHVRDAGRQLVEDAIDNEEWPAANPFAKADPLKIDEKDYEVLTRKEARLLLRHLSWKWRPLFAVAIYLGPRRKTIFHIRVADVDMKARTISFNTTKTGRRIKHIPIPSELMPYVRRALRDAGDSEWLFINRDGNRHSRWSKALTRVLRNTMRDAGIRRDGDRLPAITFHGLRRVSSCLHQEAGCHPWIVSRVLGHSQASLAMMGSTPETMTAKRYSVYSDRFVRSQLEKLTLK